MLEIIGNDGYNVRSLLTRSRRSQLRRAPFQFRPRNWRAFFGALRWKLAEARYLAVEGERLGRTPPLPTWIALGLMPEKLRTTLQQQYGYAILTRA